MKRASEEKNRTIREWRKHHDQHLLQDGVVRCRCDKQIGRFRKGQRAYGCGNPHCYLCHFEKLMNIPTIADLRRNDDYQIGLLELIENETIRSPD